jgi:hypothetical protein
MMHRRGTPGRRLGTVLFTDIVGSTKLAALDRFAVTR